MKPIFWECPHCHQFHTDADAPAEVTCDLCGLKFRTKFVKVDPKTINVAEFSYLLETAESMR